MKFNLNILYSKNIKSRFWVVNEPVICLSKIRLISFWKINYQSFWNITTTYTYGHYLFRFLKLVFKSNSVNMSLADDHDDDDLCAPPGGNEEEELSLPRASINKIIKEIVSLFYFCLHFKTYNPNVCSLGSSCSSRQWKQRTDFELLHRVHPSDKLRSQRDM